MFTDPEYRRRGIAKELLSRVIDVARVAKLSFLYTRNL